MPATLNGGRWVEEEGETRGCSCTNASLARPGESYEID